MAGMDWFRWHHGSVTDPKFALVARKAGTTLPAVLAVWAYLLEKASAAEFRGCFGEIDCEAVDCLFSLDDGTTDTILIEMDARKLIADEYVVRWDDRQVKREREDNTNADRQAKHRAKQEQVTPSNASVTPSNASYNQETPRVDKSRQEKNIKEEKTETPPSAPVSKKPSKPKLVRFPPDFVISDRVKKWAAEKHHGNLEKHFEHFASTAKAKGYEYADWDEGFMKAVRENWAKVPIPPASTGDPMNDFMRRIAV